jgi:hypothetical protein
MKPLFEISLDERQRILEMHINATKNNYLIEQHEPPKLNPGEFTSPNGDILRLEKSIVPPLSETLGTKFIPGDYKNFDVSNDPKMIKVVEWLNNPDIKDKKISIVVTAGSSKSGPGENDEERRQFNVNLAIKRGETAISKVKEFLNGKIPNELLNSINYTIDTSQAHKGPEFDPTKKDTSKDEKYQDYQFVTISCIATGESEVLKKVSPKFQPWAIYPTPDTSHAGIVTFCIDGMFTDRDGTYRCKGQKKAVYYANQFDNNPTPKQKMRWIPIEEKSEVYDNSDLRTGRGIFANGGAWCFQYENRKNDPKCKAFYDKWDAEYPKYSLKYREGGMGDWETPGPEVGEYRWNKIQKNWGKTSFIAEG